MTRNLHQFTPVIQSHTATQEWQSFEMKMRRRRLERCVLRASVALEAGVLEDAAEALDEARRLDPNEITVQELAGQLAAARAGVATVPGDFLPAMAADVPSGRSRVAAGMAALSLVLLSGLGGWWWTSSRAQAPRPSAAAVEPAVSADKPTPFVAPASAPSVRISETAVTVPVVTGEVPRNRDTEPVATTGSPGVRTAAGAAPAAPAPAEVQQREEAPIVDSSPAQLSAPAPEYAARPMLGGTVPGNKIDPAPLPPEPPAAAPPAATIVTATEGIVAPADAIRIAAPPPPQPAAPPVAATAPADEQIIRGVLGRYEAAYSRLDAAAASTVWPGVNQRALASAFQGLASQSISLGRCDVRVNGPTALAQCTGSAQWTPKVGGGAQRAARQWRFDLRNNGGTWVITQATAR